METRSVALVKIMMVVICDAVEIIIKCAEVGGEILCSG